MRKFALLLVVILLSSLILSACAGGSGSAGPEKSVEAYLNALVAADAEKMSTLSCADWETNAMLELDSFQAVEASLKDMKCTQSGSDGDTALVGCEGQIVVSYDGEATEIPLDSRTYDLVQSGGEWLICGYR
ncbi:MAG: hypothetical protein CVU39_08135 [Chloroflexi bacterium HGW-Chloroflexi-10]|nr:MAG: hypothetical protein CVU39_08135 [Chloroflexi bacterium HGW-Chloroflexi-10]